MKTKKEIVENWLPRYTGIDLDSFGKYIQFRDAGSEIDIIGDMGELIK